MLNNHSPRNTTIRPATTYSHGRTSSLNQFTHVLVPTSMSSIDGPALSFGAELAMLYQARLTVLHVYPLVTSDPSIHWLDGIERLYQSVDRVDNGQVKRILDVMKATREKVRQFCVRALPDHMLDELTIQAECRAGETAETIVRFAHDQHVDLIVMSGGRNRRLPLQPSVIRYVLKHASSQVLLTGPRKTQAVKNS